MNKQEIFIAKTIFTGEEWLSDHAVVIDGQLITRVMPQSMIPTDAPVRDFGGQILAPAYIDIQIYGAYGKLLSEFPEVDALLRLNDYCRSGGAAHFMPTLATNHLDVFKKAIDTIRTYWSQGGLGVLGLHMEGPWINPVKRGAHIESLVRKAALDEVKEILAYGEGVIKMITMAPELTEPEVLDFIISRGIVVSAGHSNASYEQALKGFAQGIRAVTHLYNAMSPLAHREPGLVGASMDDDRVMASIIPDGHHVSYPAVRIAKSVMKDRLFVITDAVAETSSGPYQHQLMEDKYESAGILSGSALTMHQAVLNLVNHCHIDWEEALKMCSLYPARVLGLDEKLGKIKKTFTASLIAIDPASQSCLLIS
ncbi:MAG: N-acetylglucosamine-6-phosphate deacetylase [Saprospiraceae bacterium]|nr:N-acetylglucosamine-6-phosphate deacetylase [Saprospiraceae bacterium]